MKDQEARDRLSRLERNQQDLHGQIRAIVEELGLDVWALGYSNYRVQKMVECPTCRSRVVADQLRMDEAIRDAVD